MVTLGRSREGCLPVQGKQEGEKAGGRAPERNWIEEEGLPEMPEVKVTL
jgi:hypothetical protein